MSSGRAGKEEEAAKLYVFLFFLPLRAVRAMQAYALLYLVSVLGSLPRGLCPKCWLQSYYMLIPQAKILMIKEGTSTTFLILFSPGTAVSSELHPAAPSLHFPLLSSPVHPTLPTSRCFVVMSRSLSYIYVLHWKSSVEL